MVAGSVCVVYGFGSKRIRENGAANGTGSVKSLRKGMVNRMEMNIDRLSKQYGSKIAVDRVSLKLKKGVYGLLGADGAGKTTLMRMLCGILKPTAGSISFDGEEPDSEGYKARLGYLPQDFGYYPDFTGIDFLLYMGALKGLSKSHAKERAGELLKLVTLEEAAKRKSRPIPAA